MKASRNFHFSPLRAMSLALAAGFLSLPLVMADPLSTDSDAKSGASLVVESKAAKVESEAVQAESSKAEDEKSIDTAKEETKEETASSEERSKTDTVAVAKDAEADPTTDELHEEGIRHWNISKRYLNKDWDLDLAQVELDLAIMDYPDLKIAHRDLCLVSLMKFNVWRSIAEFMMTVGIGEAIPLTDDESVSLLEDGMVKHYKKGLVYARQQDWEKSVTELEFAAQLIPDDFAVQRSLAFAYANLGDFAKAEEHYKRTFALSPQDGSSRADLAYFLAQNGKMSEAQKELEEAVKTQPKAAAYHIDLSFMAESRGDLDTASKELAEAVKLNPNHADLWAHLGKVLERKGSKSEAIGAYIHAINLDPKMGEAQQALNKLQGVETATPDPQS